jgi:CDP-diacylglycerol--glycerol-3-phosphate 3-phosphatidyltransferase
MTDVDRQVRRLPLLLTLFRLAAGPVVAGLVLWASASLPAAGPAFGGVLYLAAAVLFTLAAITDWLDGALARRFNAVTATGAALDHIADKVLVACALLALAYAALPLDLVVAAIVIMARDLVVAGLRESLAGQGRMLRVEGHGKAKAAAAMAGVACELAFQAAGLLGGSLLAMQALAIAARALLWAAAVLALFGGVLYARAALWLPDTDLQP